MKRKVTVTRLKQIKTLILEKASYAILLGEVGALLERLDQKAKWQARQSTKEGKTT